MKESAPEMLSGIIAESIKGKEVEEVYDFLLNANIWDLVPQGQQQFLLSYKPWGLDWLTLEWLVSQIDNINRAVSCLIRTSPELQAKLSSDIQAIKQKLD